MNELVKTCAELALYKTLAPLFGVPRFKRQRQIKLMRIKNEARGRGLIPILGTNRALYEDGQESRIFSLAPLMYTQEFPPEIWETSLDDELVRRLPLESFQTAQRVLLGLEKLGPGPLLKTAEEEMEELLENYYYEPWELNLCLHNPAHYQRREEVAVDLNTLPPNEEWLGRDDALLDFINDTSWQEG